MLPKVETWFWVILGSLCPKLMIFAKTWWRKIRGILYEGLYVYFLILMFDVIWYRQCAHAPRRTSHTPPHPLYTHPYTNAHFFSFYIYYKPCSTCMHLKASTKPTILNLLQNDNNYPLWPIWVSIIRTRYVDGATWATGCIYIIHKHMGLVRSLLS